MQRIQSEQLKTGLGHLLSKRLIQTLSERAAWNVAFILCSSISRFSRLWSLFTFSELSPFVTHESSLEVYVWKWFVVILLYMYVSQPQFHIQSSSSSMAEMCFLGLYTEQCLNETQTETSQKTQVYYSVPRLIAAGKSLLPKCLFCRLVVCICGESEDGGSMGWGCVGGPRLGSELCEQWCQFGSDWPIVCGKYVSDCQELVSFAEAERGEIAGGAAQEDGLMRLRADVTVSVIVGFLLFSRITTKQTIMLKTTPIKSFIAQNGPEWVTASRTEYSWEAQFMQII